MSKKRRVKPAGTDYVEPKENQESETEDIYNDKQREAMLNEDEITASENAFMEGREMGMKKNRKSGHDDSVSVELSKQE
ncbi:MAG: hypothetical protein NWF05_03645, partial [Candidatus Bathyarchaeota archaeon]|nr:hypothetical protein [Candidatus Bathyarchaeota archaeon]